MCRGAYISRVLDEEEEFLGLALDKINVVKPICPLFRGQPDVDVFPWALQRASWETAVGWVEGDNTKIPGTGGYLEVGADIFHATLNESAGNGFRGNCLGIISLTLEDKLASGIGEGIGFLRRRL